jgi:hypothetical protein
MFSLIRIGLVLSAIILTAGFAPGQDAARVSDRSAAAARGSETAKGGFRNEDEIAAKFNNWQTDEEAAAWLAFMGYKRGEIRSVAAAKPHGEKADVQVKITTAAGEKAEGISIKLVSSPQGFNQIDKRWLRQYVRMWNIPADVEAALKLFLGESKPDRPSRNPERMFLNELDAAAQKKIVEWFAANREKIAADIFGGEGAYRASWMLVAVKSGTKPRWVLRSIDHTIKYFAEGPVEITRQGNLRIGRITMQRKGGDGGRETARMLQFKINPALLLPPL